MAAPGMVAPADRETHVRTPVDVTGVPNFPWEQIRFLYHCGYYDGPLSGFCLIAGEKLFFDCISEGNLTPEYIAWWNSEDESDESGPEPHYVEGYWRRYALYRLSPEDLAFEERCHAAFREHVGVHTDYDENGKRPLGHVRPQSEWSKFYDDPQWKNRPVYHKTLVGWFDSI
jgi:hypothetical protein